MNKEYVVTDVESTMHGDLPIWRIIYDKGDGTVHLQVMPQSILLSRAAEYDIDPTDTDTLIDMVLHEPFMAPEEGSGLPALFSAPSVSSAREAHLARIAHAKENRVSAVSAKRKAKGAGVSDPLDVMRRDHKVDHEMFNAIKNEVKALRSHLRKEA